MTVVIPKEGGVLGIDTVAINKGSKKAELAYKFITSPSTRGAGQDRPAQEGQPTVTNADGRSETAKLPGSSTPPSSGRPRPSTSIRS